MPSKTSDRYVGKVDTIALLLLGGINPETLQEWYPDMTKEESPAHKEKLSV
jgi:hypothetical protein